MPDPTPIVRGPRFAVLSLAVACLGLTACQGAPSSAPATEKLASSTAVQRDDVRAGRAAPSITPAAPAAKVPAAPAAKSAATRPARPKAAEVSPSSRPTAKSAPKPAAAASDGWKRTFFDDFTGAELNDDWWGVYETRPNVFVRDGRLIVRSSYEDGQWVSGGLSSAKAGSQRYGKWVIRYRAAKGSGVTYVALLYPAGGGWPPEIDFAEDHGGGDRSGIMGVTHWGAENHQIVKVKEGDFSQWHEAGVIIEPGKVSYLLDGEVWATVEGAESAPDERMWLGMQTYVYKCADRPGCPNSTTPRVVDMEVDWVARYARASG